MGVSLHVIVIGGGVCGLSSAIALRRAGHQVTVYEKYAASADSGAGIGIPSNAVRILKRWGLDLEGAGMMPMVQGVVLDGKTLEIYKVQSPWDVEGVEHHFHLTTRRDLQMMLMKEIQKDDNGVGGIQVEHEKQIMAYVCNPKT